jgi:cell division protein FtsL
VAVKKITNTKTTMATKKISEDTEVKLDLKTIAILVGGAISLASMWFTLEGEIQDLNNKINNFGSEEFVQKMEFQLKDELVRSTIIQIEKSTDVLKEDILDNKQSIKELEDKVYKR